MGDAETVYEEVPMTKAEWLVWNENRDKRFNEECAQIILHEPDALHFAKMRIEKLKTMPHLEGTQIFFRQWEEILNTMSRDQIAAGMRGEFPEQLRTTSPILNGWKFRDRYSQKTQSS